MITKCKKKKYAKNLLISKNLKNLRTRIFIIIILKLHVKYFLCISIVVNMGHSTHIIMLLLNLNYSLIIHRISHINCAFTNVFLNLFSQ